jgi:hypothetical protein
MPWVSFVNIFSIKIHIDSILAVENEYDGPHLDADGRITKEFMFELLPYFENQKKLHKKYAYQVMVFIVRLEKNGFGLFRLFYKFLHYLKHYQH